MSKAEVNDVDGLDEFIANTPAPMVMGITPDNMPRPAFRLEKLPPRMRTKTLMVAQWEEDENGKRTKLIGFKPKEVTERVDGGYMVHCMKGHKVAIDSLEQLHKMGLGGYVPMLKVDNFEGTTVDVRDARTLMVPSGTTKVA